MTKRNEELPVEEDILPVLEAEIVEEELAPETKPDIYQNKTEISPAETIGKIAAAAGTFVLSFLQGMKFFEKTPGENNPCQPKRTRRKRRSHRD